VRLPVPWCVVVAGFAKPDRKLSGTSSWYAPEIREAVQKGLVEDEITPLIGGAADIWCLGLVFVAFR
jgi:hypothetical protein